MLIKDSVWSPRRGPNWTLLGMVLAIGAMALLLPHGAASIPVFGLGFAGMILDAQCVLSDEQAVTVSASSTNTYDTGAAGNDFSIGEPLGVAFNVTVAAKTSNADETYQFAVIQSANADLSAPDILIATDVAFLTRAKLVAGFRFYLPIPPGMKTKRYLGARYITGGTGPTITMEADIKPLSFLQNDYINASGFKITS